MQVSRTTNYKYPRQWRILCDDEELDMLRSALHGEQLAIEAHVLNAPAPEGLSTSEWKSAGQVRLAYTKATKGAST